MGTEQRVIEHKYGEFTVGQFEEAKTFMRKQIFTLLLYADPKLKEEYKNYDLNKAFDTILRKFNGLNSILYEPPELVRIISILEAAWMEYKKPDFDFKKYRVLILEAGNVVLKIKDKSEEVE